MPTLTKLYTMQEASEHNTKDDCWVVIDGKVYDVTSYLDEHPGGDDVVVEVTGKDATDEFEDAGHSREARELLKDFFIGELDPSPTAAPEHKTSPQKKFSEDIAQKLNDSMMQYWAVPAGIICVSLVAGLIFLRKKSTS